MTLQTFIVEDAQREEWNLYVSSHASRTPYHVYEWREFFSTALRKQTFYLAASDRDAIVGVLPLVRQRSRLFGDYIVSLPYVNYGGLLVDSPLAERALTEAAGELFADLPVDHIELRGTSNVGELPSKTRKVSMRLPLPASPDELHSSFSSKLRSQIKRPMRENPEIRHGGIELLDDFYKVFSRNMRDLGTPVYSKQFFEEILRLFPKITNLVVIDFGGTPVAAGLLVHGDRWSEVPWASSDRRYNRYSFNMLLYWELLKASIGHGANEFDFGRCSLDSGTYRFKKQWGAKPVQLHWSYFLREGAMMPELNPENSRFSFAIKVWQSLPVPVANFIGPYLARNLP